MTDDLIERLRREATVYARDSITRKLMTDSAAALEAAQMGLRYAVRVWVLSDEIEWSDAEIDEAVERVIGYAKEEAHNG